MSTSKESWLEMLRKSAGQIRYHREQALQNEAWLRNELDTLISDKHLAAKDIAKRVGVSPQHLSDIRHGRRSPGDKVVAKLAKLK